MSIYSRIYRYRTVSNDETKRDPATIVQDSRFLNLPREIRDHVLDYVLNDPNDLPLRPPIPGERKRCKINDSHYPPYRSFRYPSCVWTCRQLRHECFDLASRQAKCGRITGKLDIIVKGYLLFPTWIYLPPALPRETPFDLKVNLRIFSTEAFRSNDGWPRQPGAAFRDLLWILNNLLHNGPSLESNQDTENGLYRINKLSVHITFHDDYTPDTFPETAHNILRMLKQLAAVGLTSNIVKTVKAHVEYNTRGKNHKYDGEWNTPEQCDPAKVQEGNNMGFFCPAQIYSRSRYPTSHSA